MSNPRIVIRRVPVFTVRSTHTSASRHASTVLPASNPDLPIQGYPNLDPRASHKTPLSRIPTNSLLRSLVLTTLMGQTWLLNPSMLALKLICNSKTAALNPDRNPILNRIMRWALYNQFAVGTNATEVTRSLRKIKNIGYQGISLGHSKEVVLMNTTDNKQITQSGQYSQAHYQAVNDWKEGTLSTLRMIKPQDFLAIKLTGAGTIAVDAMKAKKPMPQVVSDAMNEICEATRQQGSRLWIDAEQQALQPALDAWTIELMRKYNRNGEALVYNTIQAYLKDSKSNASRHVTLAAQEGWTVAIKLVRGAYIDHEERSVIHDTKEDTDRSYDAIADMLISQRKPEGSQDATFPSSALFLATHNAASAERAIERYLERTNAGLPTATLECGQVQGMADELSSSLLEKYEECARDPVPGKAPPPGIFKCQVWGTVSECLGYLYRRAVENRGAVERTENMRRALAQELYRRFFGWGAR